jgi:hypothetical protein
MLLNIRKQGWRRKDVQEPVDSLIAGSYVIAALVLAFSFTLFMPLVCSTSQQT